MPWRRLPARARHAKARLIWHTTGSGKTLTSFKAAQIISSMPDVEKVLFVVDRADLDYQTMKEFNAFQPDAGQQHGELVRHFAD